MIPVVVVVEETTTYDKFGARAVPRLFNTIGSSLISVSAFVLYVYIYVLFHWQLSLDSDIFVVIVLLPSTRSSFFF
jgi:hypothetical protein